MACDLDRDNMLCAMIIQFLNKCILDQEFINSFFKKPWV